MPGRIHVPIGFVSYEFMASGEKCGRSAAPGVDHLRQQHPNSKEDAIGLCSDEAPVLIVCAWVLSVPLTLFSFKVSLPRPFIRFITC
jgi:hypothetical protein